MGRRSVAIAIVIGAALPVVGLLMAIWPDPELAARLAAAGLKSGAAASPWPVLGSTALLAVVVSALSLSLGTLLAFAEHRWAFPRWLSIASLAPLAIPSYIIAASGQRAFDPSGWLGKAMGLESPFEGLGPAALVLVVVCAPYVQLLVGAALLRLPWATEEAARSLGAGPWRRWRYVLLPFLGPSLGFSLLLVAGYTIADFGAVSVLNAPVLTWRVYQAYELLNVQQAASWGAWGLLLLLPILILAQRLHGPGGGEQGPPRVPAKTTPGPLLRGLATLAHLPVIMVGLVIPIAELTQWTLEGGMEVPLLAALGNTLLLAVTGAVVTLIFAGLAAWASLGQRRWIDAVVFFCSSMPGLLLAFGLLLGSLWIPTRLGFDPWRDTLRDLGVLVLAGYALRFCLQGFGPLKAGLLRLDPRQHEAARSLGAARSLCIRKVLLPPMFPAIGAASLLLLLALVKELPITLLLGPVGRGTLAYRVWERYGEGFLADAGVSGLTLLFLAALLQHVTRRWRHYA